MEKVCGRPGTEMGRKHQNLDVPALGGRVGRNARQPNSIAAVNADALSPVRGVVCP